MTADLPDLGIDERRLWDRHQQMARLGAIAGEGVNRACLTALDREARRLLIGWAVAAGAATFIDDAANLWLRREGQAALVPVLTGSHMDTQPMGGRFDGIYGVLAGIEVLSALHGHGIHTARPIEVVAWTNEEGGRFAPGCMGSMAWAGVRSIAGFADVRDHEGLRFGDALAEQLALEADLPRRAMQAERPYAYVEAHIEQGPLLEMAGVPVGVVTGIQGSRWFTVTLQGASAHAGTTPLALRQDAVQDFVRVATALNAVMHDPDDVLRFTIGRIAVEPNTSNSVAGQVSFSIDLRHPDAATLDARAAAVLPAILGAVRHTRATVAETFHAAPLGFDSDIQATIARAADRQGLPCLHLASGAFHDAQFVARVCPAGMIFVPCRGGVSHHPSEYATPRALALGAQVLAATLLDLAGREA